MTPKINVFLDITVRSLVKAYLGFLKNTARTFSTCHYVESGGRTFLRDTGEFLQEHKTLHSKRRQSSFKWTVPDLLATEVHVTSFSCFAVQNKLQHRNGRGRCSLQSGQMKEGTFWAAGDALRQTESHRSAASMKDHHLFPTASTNDIKLPSIFTQFFYWNLLLFAAVVLSWDYPSSVWNLKKIKIICCLLLPAIRKGRFVSTFLVFAHLSFW